MQTIDSIRAIVNQVRCALVPNWRVALCYQPGQAVWYLQVEATDQVDAVTGQQMEWTGRKWLLSLHMTETEIVCTAFKALEAALDHELREHFTYKGARVFDPHRAIGLLAEIAGRADAIDARLETLA